MTRTLCPKCQAPDLKAALATSPQTFVARPAALRPRDHVLTLLTVDLRLCWRCSGGAR